MTRRSCKTPARLAALTLFALLALGAGCTQGTDPSDSGGQTARDTGSEGEPAAADDTGELSADDPAPDPLASAGEGSSNTPEPADLNQVEQLWIDSGASPELASCYRTVLENTGVTEVADLNELTDVIEGLDEAARADMDACVGGS